MTIGKIESEEKYKIAIEKTKEVTDVFEFMQIWYDRNGIALKKLA